ncbi:MAG: Spi family protease inhibitor [Muribaculaceae bacterium]|nr:Spi family protease inhibitor [Muribaculaceae bacterium]
MKSTSIQKAFCSGLLLTLMATGVYARQLSPSDALSRAKENMGQKRISGSSNYDLIYTEETEGEKFVYVFNTNDGFIVVSADDNMPALLGYSGNGTFDPSNTSPALKWWLTLYAEEAAETCRAIESGKLTEKRPFLAQKTQRE